MKESTILKALLLALLLCPVLEAENGRPEYKLLRFDEEWPLAWTSPDWFSGLKNITISEESSIRLSVGGHRANFHMPEAQCFERRPANRVLVETSR